MKRIPNDESELFAEASTAYVNYHKKEGNMFYDAPSKYLTEIGKRFVYLRNVRGLIVKYDYQKRELVV